ncbi:MAG: type II toxin-antitoxin system VapC family toxin [Polyangiaceae bacterium]|nr:type II toxin-antitoxin system VapC family toxin [Polyangiaceae bacterium]
MDHPYLDTSAIIYLVEGSASVRARIAALVAKADCCPTGHLLTSRLAQLECRAKPLRDEDATALAIYDAFFTRARLTVVEITPLVLDCATELHARHGFTVPDAIHLASAMEARADSFVTANADLANCPDVNVELLTL